MIGWSIIARVTDGGPNAYIPKMRAMISSSDNTATAAPALARHEAAQLMRWATYASVATAFVLIAAKVVAYVLTDSVSLLSTLLDSFSTTAQVRTSVNGSPMRTALVLVRHQQRMGSASTLSVGAAPGAPCGALPAGKIATVIDCRYRLSKVPEALQYLGDRHAKGKVVIIVE